MKGILLRVLYTYAILFSFSGYDDRFLIVCCTLSNRIVESAALRKPRYRNYD